MVQLDQNFAGRPKTEYCGEHQQQTMHQIRNKRKGSN